MSSKLVSRNSLWICALIVTLLCGFGRSPVFAQGLISIVIHNIENQYNPVKSGYDINVHLSVVDPRGIPISGLTASDFLVREDGSEVSDFTVGPVAGGISIVLAIDASGSMIVGGKMESVKGASRTFIQQLGDEDQVGLISFSEHPKVEINLTEDHTAVQNFIDLLEPVPGAATCLWDAAYEAVELASMAQHGRRVVILLTDGIDERAGEVCSRKTIDDVEELASDPTIQVPIYTLGIGKEINKLDLQGVADKTGGRFSQDRSAVQVERLFENLSLQLRAGYTLHYWTNATSGEHSLFVQVDYQGNRDQDTSKYRAPEMPSSATIVGIEDNQIIQEATKISVRVVGEIAPTRVDFYMDHRRITIDEEEPFEGVLEVDDLQPGRHALRVVVYAADGKVIAVAKINAIYKETGFALTGEISSLSISFKGLQNGQVVEGPVPLEVSIDPVDVVRRVVLLVDDSPVVDDSDPPFDLTWDIDGLERGKHSLSVVAYGAGDKELARESIEIRYSPPAPINLVLGAVALIVVGVGAVRVIRGRRKREARAHLAISTKEEERADFVGETMAVLTIEACQDSDLIGQRFEIWENEVVIGRSEACDIVIPVQPISRKHAVIVLRGDVKDFSMTLDEVVLADVAPIQRIGVRQFYIYDGDPDTRKPSTYGTYVDNVKATSEEGLLLSDGSRIRFGRPIMEGRVSPVILKFEDLRGALAPTLVEELVKEETIGPQDETLIDPSASLQEGAGGVLTPTESKELEEQEGRSFATEDFELIVPEEKDLTTREGSAENGKGREHGE